MRISGQHDMTVLAALRLNDADDLLLAIDVTGLETDNLAGSEPAAISQRQHHARLQRDSHGQQPFNFLRALITTGTRCGSLR